MTNRIKLIVAGALIGLIGITSTAPAKPDPYRRGPVAKIEKSSWS
jgi:hypothetical protein